MEAYFTSCHFTRIPIARLEVIPILSSPSAPESWGLILYRSSCHQSPSPAQVERTAMFYKHIFTTVCLCFTLVAVCQNSELTVKKTRTGQMSLSHTLSLPSRFPLKSIDFYSFSFSLTQRLLLDKLTDSWEC